MFTLMFLVKKVVWLILLCCIILTYDSVRSKDYGTDLCTCSYA
jgi:hypothetical protein